MRQATSPLEPKRSEPGLLRDNWISSEIVLAGTPAFTNSTNEFDDNSATGTKSRITS
jgi:hypothetical protein